MKKFEFVVLFLSVMCMLFSCIGMGKEKTAILGKGRSEKNDTPKIIKVEEYENGFDDAKRYRVTYEDGTKIVFRLLNNSQVMVCNNFTDNENYNPKEDGDWAIGYNDYKGDLVIPETVVINDQEYTVTAIESGAFWDTGLTSITIPKTITNIDVGAFFLNDLGVPGFGAERPPLEKINVMDGNTRYDSRENCNAIIETATNTLIVGFKNTIIPEGVKNIGEWAFCDCDIVSLTIPASVETIGEYAFERCYDLFSVIINNPNLEIDEGMFSSKVHIKGGKVKRSEDMFDIDASSYLFTENDLKHLSAKQLTYLRNQIYAKHGYTFKSQELTNHFKQYGWYHPTKNFTESSFNQIEKANVAFIKNYQEQNGMTYKPH